MSRYTSSTKYMLIMTTHDWISVHIVTDFAMEIIADGFFEAFVLVTTSGHKRVGMDFSTIIKHCIVELKLS